MDAVLAGGHLVSASLSAACDNALQPARHCLHAWLSVAACIDPGDGEVSQIYVI